MEWILNEIFRLTWGLVQKLLCVDSQTFHSHWVLKDDKNVFFCIFWTFFYFKIFPTRIDRTSTIVKIKFHRKKNVYVNAMTAAQHMSSHRRRGRENNYLRRHHNPGGRTNLLKNQKARTFQTKYLCKQIAALLKTNFRFASEWTAGLASAHANEIYFDFFFRFSCRRHPKCWRLLLQPFRATPAPAFIWWKNISRLDNGFEDNYPFVTIFCFASSRTWTFSFFSFFVPAEREENNKRVASWDGGKSIFIAHQKQMIRPDRGPHNNHNLSSIQFRRS